MDTLMAKVEEPPSPLVTPPEAVMDRIHFVINNVTASNLIAKVRISGPSGQGHDFAQYVTSNDFDVRRS